MNQIPNLVTESGKNLFFLDKNQVQFSIGDKIEIRYTSGLYGQTNTVTGILQKVDQFGGLTLDDAKRYLPKSNLDFQRYKEDQTNMYFIFYNEHTNPEHYHENWVIKL